MVRIEYLEFILIAKYKGGGAGGGQLSEQVRMLEPGQVKFFAVPDVSF
jgi:hypothetical protein